MAQIKKGDKAVVVRRDGHFFPVGTVIEFMGMDVTTDVYRLYDIYNFRGKDYGWREGSNLVKQGLRENEFILAKDEKHLAVLQVLYGKQD